MAFKRRWVAPGELSDAEIEDVLSIAVRDSPLIEARKRVVETMSRMRSGSAEGDDDLLDDLFGKLLVEIKRVAITKYPRMNVEDLRELEAQVMELPLNGNSSSATP